MAVPNKKSIKKEKPEQSEISDAGAKKQPKLRIAMKKKLAKVSELIALSKKYKSVSIISAVKTPNKIIQKLKKQLKGKAVFAMAKKVVLRKCLESTSQSLVESLKEPSYLVFTDLSPYELYSFVRQCRESVFASAGSISTSDILVEKATTDLQPGPVLTELKGAGLDVTIDKGKIAIKSNKIVAKKGEKITKPVANVLRLLNIKPLEIFARYTAGLMGGILYDSELLSQYDQSSVRSMLSYSLGSAINLSVSVGYYTEQNINLLLGTAVMQAKGLAFSQDLVTDYNVPALLAKSLMQAEGISSHVKLGEGENK